MSYFGEGVLDLIELGNGLVRKTPCPINERFVFYSEGRNDLTDLNMVFLEGSNFIEKYLLENHLKNYLRSVMINIPNITDDKQELSESIDKIANEVLSEKYANEYTWRLFNIPFSFDKSIYKNHFIILSEIVKPNHLRICACFTGDSSSSEQYFQRVCVLSAFNETPYSVTDLMTRH